MTAKAKSTILNFLFLLIMLEMCCSAIMPQYIGSIRRNPRHFKDKQVIVRGEVTQIFALPFIDKGFCKIKDDTGEIWVKPAERVPHKGEILTVKGTVTVGVTMADRTFGIIIVEDFKNSLH